MVELVELVDLVEVERMEERSDGIVFNVDPNKDRKIFDVLIVIWCVVLAVQHPVS